MLINGINYVNCTPHELRVFDSNRNVHLIPDDSGHLIRVQKQFVNGYSNGFYDNRVEFSCIPKLPPRMEDTIYIVSCVTLDMIKHAGLDRKDFRSPGKIHEVDGKEVCLGFVG